jgi:hypothetical protein
MKITLLGSTGYQDKMIEHAKKLLGDGHYVRMPAFDSRPELDTAMKVCEFNRECIEWADEVHVIWDARSIGFIFDFGMVFALRKPMKLIFLNQKQFPHFVQEYSDLFSKAGIEAIGTDE